MTDSIPMPDPRDDDLRVEEVRVALALNGGVSLAVWMGGCSVEFDSARRAHLAPEPADGAAPPRSVYHALCTAFARRLVVDVMSGSSAGGVNGALLGAAISRRRRLGADFVRGRWLALGDFTQLLQRTSNPSPRSLMQGDRFHADLHASFEALIDGEPTGATELPAGQHGLPSLDVKLDITTTDLVGERRAFRDAWERELVAREHRARFRFRDERDYSAAALASAARASASFPVAFEPWRVTGEAKRLAGFPQARWVVDGGLLDNAPIAAALALIPTRPAMQEVQRFVCYVNAEPPADDEDVAADDEPALAHVAGAVVELPRKAPFVDHLTALERATRPGLLGDDAPALKLIGLDLDALEQTAEALLPTYRRRRLLQSLQQLLEQPAAVRAAFEQYADSAAVSWLPRDLAPLGGGRWQWGLHTAERVLQLLLDVLRRALAAAANLEQRMLLLAARGDVHAQLQSLYELQRAVGAATARERIDARMRAAIDQLQVVDPLPLLRTAAAALFSVRGLLGAVGGHAVAVQLFGAGAAAGAADEPLSQARFERLLRRALAIEVVRRAIEDDEQVDSTQRLQFAQLTPFTASPIFTARPLHERGWASPRDKLTGLGLQHFAAFYRSSWRANDFLWGRLDATARIVDMLVSADRASLLARDGADPAAWDVLALALLPAGAEDDQQWLVREALVDAGALAPEAAPPPAPAGPPVPPDPAASRAALDALRTALAAALRRDLDPAAAVDGRPPGMLTRCVCTRAAQYEVLAHELPVLVERSRLDAKEGAGAAALELPLAEGPAAAIRLLRGAPSLPRRITSSDEASSRLAVRTGAHAGLVGLGMLRTAGVPLARALFGLRALLLPVAGSVASRPGTRATVVLAYWAAAMLFVSRLLSTPQQQSFALGELSWAAGLTALIALAVVAGVAFVPAFRAYWSGGARRWLHGGAAALLLACGGVVAVGLAHWAGDLSWSNLAVGAAAAQPREWLLWLVVAFVLGGPISAIPAAVRGRFDKLLQQPWGGPAALLAVLALALLVLLSSGWTAVDAVRDDGGWWRWTAGLLALAAAPLACAAYLFVRRAPTS